MVVELSGTIRGEPVLVRWSDGALSGSAVLLERLKTVQDGGRFAAGDGADTPSGWDLADLGEAVRALELAAAQRLEMHVVEDRPQPLAS